MDFLDSTNIGKNYKGFTILSIENLPDYKAKAVYLRHKNTGLEVFHVVNKDKENMFSFGFRTLAKDSKGTAHIMEHSTLCGSEKFPLKEPFTTLENQSVKTFLNALTYPDKTVYPGASLVVSDFYNLFNVYADAVFFPLISEQTFLQEGHRIEVDENGKFSIQGVVYNEMKGNYTSFNPVAVDAVIGSMFPDSFFSYDSGGDPLDIPNLTYEEFKAFHQKFYSPSNCLLYLYGDIPTEKHLDFLAENYMERLEKKYGLIENTDFSPLPFLRQDIKDLQKLNKHKTSVKLERTAPKTGSSGSMVSISWYSGSENMEKVYLSEVLAGNDSSPMSKKLKASKLGEDLAPINGNFAQSYENFFSFGLSGVKKSNQQKVYNLIESSIKEIYQEGISQKDIDSAIMGIDFELREVTRYWGPFSLVIMEKAMKSWNYGLNPAESLNPFTKFEEVKAKIREDKDYTRNLIKKYFIDNPVKVYLTVDPSKEYLENRSKKEEDYIRKLTENINMEELKKQLEDLHEYQQRKETEEELKCIPHLHVKDLTLDIDKINTEFKTILSSEGNEIPLFINKEATNGIIYINVLFPFDSIDPSYYKDIPLLGQVLTNMGWNNKNWADCIAESSSIMGDVWARTTIGKVNSEVPEIQEFSKQFEKYNFLGRNWIGLACKALSSETEKTLDLLAEIITTMDFKDKERFITLMSEFKTGKKESIISNGSNYALTRAKAPLSANFAMSEILWGLTQFENCQSYKKSQAKKILKRLEYIYKTAVNSGSVIHITGDEESLEKIMPCLSAFATKAQLKNLCPAKDYELEDLLPYIMDKENLQSKQSREVLKVASQIGYAATAFNSSGYLTKEACAETVYTRYLTLHPMWEKLRTTGGAYGSGAYINSIEHSCMMYTYRDPNPVKSFDTFIDILSEGMENPLSKEDVDCSIISLFSDITVPMSPNNRGNTGFEWALYGLNQEIKLKQLENILNVNTDDIKLASERLFKNAKNERHEVVICDNSIQSTGNILKLHL